MSSPLDREQEFGKLNLLIESSGKILLATHCQPDADGLGSLYALQKFLLSKGKECDIYFNENLSANLKVVDLVSDSAGGRGYDLIIGSDYGSIRRLCLPFAPEEKFLDKLVTIDHHDSCDVDGVLTILDNNACSASLMVYRFLKWDKFSFSSDVATALYWGMFNDSGGFAHVNVDKEVFEAASDLVFLGAAARRVVTNFLYRRNSVLSVWGKVLKDLSYDGSVGLVYACLDYEFFNGYQIRLSDLSGLTNVMLRAGEAKISLLLSEFQKDFIDGSLRVSDGWPTNVAEIARRLGGGGHRRAAGFQRMGDLRESLQLVKEALI